MFPYLILLFAIAFSTLFDGKKLDKIIFIIFVLWMFILSAFRIGGTGEGDYDAYQRFYLAIDTFDKVINPDLHVEIGFRVLSFLGHLAGFSEQYIIIVMAALALIPVSYVIYRYSPYKLLSLLIWFPYFLTMNMHSSRTSVAAAFGLLFLLFLYEKKVFGALLSLMISVSFHSSSFILILAFLTTVSLKNLFFFSILIIPFSLLLSPLDMLMSILDIIGLDNISNSIRLYISSDDYGYPMVIYDPRILLNFGIVILIFLYRNTLFGYFKGYYSKLYIIGLILMLFFSNVVIMSWRVSYYFLLTGVIAIPFLLQVVNINIQRKYNVRRIMSIIFMFIYVFYSVSIIINSLPYKFIMEI